MKQMNCDCGVQLFEKDIVYNYLDDDGIEKGTFRCPRCFKVQR